MIQAGFKFETTENGDRIIPYIESVDVDTDIDRFDIDI